MGSSYEKYTSFHLRLIQTDAYRALRSSGQAALTIIKMEWNGAKFNNNGKIRMSVRQLARTLGCSTNTASAALQDLQRKGFIVVTEMARLGVAGNAKGHCYELTEHPIAGKPDGKTKSDSVVGRKLYLDWREGRDFPVADVPLNNPKGKNGITKKQNPVSKNDTSRIKNEDGLKNTVSKSDTACIRNEDVSTQNSRCTVSKSKTSLYTIHTKKLMTPSQTYSKHDLALSKGLGLCGRADGSKTVEREAAAV